MRKLFLQLSKLFEVVNHQLAVGCYIHNQQALLLEFVQRHLDPVEIRYGDVVDCLWEIIRRHFYCQQNSFKRCSSYDCPRRQHEIEVYIYFKATRIIKSQNLI